MPEAMGTQIVSPCEEAIGYNPTTMNKSSTIPVNTEPAINKTANVCGGSACIRATRIPVWSLALWRRQGVTDLRLLEMYPSITQDDLHAAWLYESSHQDEIDQDIQSNEDA
jgi:uncharacterized protein (DUF433 family)